MSPFTVLSDLKRVFKLPDPRIGKPIYLQEDGEKLGKVVSIDEETGLYTVDSSGVRLNFPEENVIEGEGGFVYSPRWFTEASRVLKELKARESLSPSTEMKESGPLRSAVNKARDIVPILLSKKESLGRKKESVEHSISRKSEERESGEIGRREYMAHIVDLNRKLKIIETNLERVDDLLGDLENSAFIDIERSYEGKKMTQDELQKNNPGRSSEGERIKKIRILKLEKSLEEQQKQVAEGYIKDRLKRVTADKKDLEKLREENKGNEKTVKFLDKKIESLDEEKSELRQKLKDLREGRIGDLEVDDGGPLEEDIPDSVVVEKTSSDTMMGIDVDTITRMGSLIFIIGLVIVLIMSLLGFI